jgi:hypothetical protein
MEKKVKSENELCKTITFRMTINQYQLLKNICCEKTTTISKVLRFVIIENILKENELCLTSKSKKS